MWPGTLFILLLLLPVIVTMVGAKRPRGRPPKGSILVCDQRGKWVEAPGPAHVALDLQPQHGHLGGGQQQQQQRQQQQWQQQQQQQQQWQQQLDAQSVAVQNPQEDSNDPMFQDPQLAAPGWNASCRESCCVPPSLEQYVLTLQHVSGCRFPQAILRGNSLLWGWPLVFCVPDLKDDNTLDFSSFSFPSFGPVTCEDGQRVVSWCSCTSAQRFRASIYGGAPSVPWKVSEAQEVHSCPHVNAIRAWCDWTGTSLEELSSIAAAQSPISVDDAPWLLLVKFPLAPREEHRAAYVVVNVAPARVASASFAVVVRRGSKWRCTMCCAGKSCRHARAVKDVIGRADFGNAPLDGDGAAVDEAEEQDMTELQALLVSYLDKETGRLRVNSKSQEIIDKLSFDHSSPVQHPAPPTWPDLRPCVEGRVCDKCGSPWHAAAEEAVKLRNGRSSIVYGLNAFHEAVVYCRVCACGARLPYDGASHGILNLNDHDLFYHDLLHWYEIQMATRAMPFYSMWRTIVASYVSSGVVSKDQVKWFMNKRAQFQEAWINFIALQHVDYSSAFTCKCITDKFQYIVADGIVLGTRKDKTSLESFWAADQTSSPVPGSLYRDRILLPNKRTRASLRLFFSKPLHGQGVTEGLDLSAFERLTAAVSNDCKELGPYLATHFMVPATQGRGRVDDEHEDRSFVFSSEPDAVQQFMLCLVSSSPVCAVLPPSAMDHVTNLLQSGAAISVTELHNLAMAAPILYDYVMHEVRAHTWRLPMRAQALLRLLVGISARSFVPANSCEFDRATAVRAATDAELSTTTTTTLGAEDVAQLAPEEQFLRSGFYYPTLPIKRRLHVYTADSRTQRTGPSCNKYKNDTKALAPGLFLMHCLKCAGCLGFHMMHDSESPGTLFEVLYTRFQVAPKLVVYDNNCHAHAYALNREPAWMRDTTFLIDKTHFLGHVGCCKAYDIAVYPSYRELNSQLAEQKNARLAIIRAHAAYMTQAVFLVYLRHYLYVGSILPC